LVALLPVVYILTYILLIYAYDFSHRAAYEILYDVRLELGERMTRLPLGYFDERNTGEIETIMNENVERLEFFLAHHFIEMVTAAFIPIFLALLLFVWDWRMALASVLPPLVALGAIFFISGRRWPQMVERFLAAQSRVNAAITPRVSRRLRRSVRQPSLSRSISKIWPRGGIAWTDGTGRRPFPSPSIRHSSLPPWW